MTTSRQTYAFSLIELLVVIAIIAVFATFLAPMMDTVLRGSKLSQASQMVQAELALARQRALAANRPIEVRFYRFGDASIPGENPANPSSGKFRALQSFEYSDDGSARPVSKVIRLPASIIMNSGESLSSLLKSTQDKSWGTETKPPIPTAGTAYDTKAFRFRPDGSTDLAFTGTVWFLTLSAESDGDPRNDLPANFATIRVDAVNGRNRLYRP